MANEYFVNSSDMTAIADAIRSKTNKSDKIFFPSGFVNEIKSIENKLYTFKKVGTITVGYAKTTIDISDLPNWQLITVDDIYFVPTNFIITKTDQTTGGTYKINKSYSGGVITAWRDSVPGQVGINFTCDVYVYMLNSDVGTIYKIGDNKPLTFGSGISIDVSSIIPEYKYLTIDNFYLDLVHIDINVTAIGGGSADIIKTYNSENGVFTFSRASISFSGSMNNYCDVYAYVPCNYY